MSFRLETILGIALIEAVLLFILIVSSLSYLRNSNEQELLERAYTTARLFATTTKDAVLATDLASLESFVQEVLTNPGIVYARVRGTDGVLAQGGETQALARPFHADRFFDEVTDGVFDAFAEIEVAGVRYGRVEIGLATETIESVIAQARRHALTLAALEMGLVALFSFMLGSYLTRSLRALQQATHHLAQGELGYQIAVRGRDELAQTAQAFNEMSQRLQEAAKARQHAEEELVRLNQELEKRVRQRTAELAELNRQLEFQALHDGLTRLPNRSLFHDRLQHHIHVGRREAQPFALMVMDLDRFKEINDAKGHQTGDLVLQEVAARLRRVLRESDTVARIGGDEFALLLPAVGEAADAQAVAEKLLQAISAPIKIGGEALEIGASLGIALFPGDGQEAEGLMRRADAAMYHAKFTRTKVCRYRPELEQRGQERHSLQAELKRAIEQDALVLHYQPKIDIATQCVAGVEALARWPHPERGLLYPEHFIPLAEQTGLIQDLTQNVLRQALRQCVIWHEQGLDLTVAVNISAQNLQDEHFPDRLAELLRHTGADPAWLELEVTETGIMANPLLAIEVIERLGAMGIQIAIDDFGTGYSSMAYLKKLSVAKIKIDKSFVMDMRQNESDAIIVRSTIDLGHNLGLEVIAEGVEDEAVWEQLKQLGCDAAQGYYLSQPLPADALSDWLRQSPWGRNRTPPGK